MDTEVQPNPPHENGSKIVEESSSDPPGETVSNEKDVQKTPPKALVVRETRSRSRTPKSKKDKVVEDNLKVNLEKIEETVNGHEEKKTRSSEKKNKEANKAAEELEDSSKNGFPEDDDSVEKGDENAKKLKRSPRRNLKEPEQSIDANSQPKDKECETVESETIVKNSDAVKPETDGVEMDPLILASDEPDPELQFDENSDMDSGKGSPIQARCKTRRSHTRNIPTPKTPKSTTDSESEKNSVAQTPTPENLNDTNDSLNVEDISTRAEVGSDATRLDYVTNNTSIFSEDSSYLNYSRERSLSETLRCLSARKTIRPLNDSYRQRAFRNNQNRSDLNLPYSGEDSVDRITGLKRKRSLTPEDRKKSRSEPFGFASYLSSPLSNFKNRFSSDPSSSSPKLTGYKDSNKDLHEEVAYSEVVEEGDKKNRCAIM